MHPAGMANPTRRSLELSERPVSRELFDTSANRPVDRAQKGLRAFGSLAAAHQRAIEIENEMIAWP